MSSNQEEQAIMPTEDQWETPLHRYISMVKDMQSYLDYTVEMEKLAVQMNDHGKQTKAYASLTFQYDTYRVARETYWEKMAQTYGVADLEAFSRDMRSLEAEIGRRSPVLAKGGEHQMPSHLPTADADISDQKLKAWLEERIVRLSLSRYELDSIQEQIEALDHHADYLQSRGLPLPLPEQQQRETLSQAYLSKYEEVRAAFEPCASEPFTPAEEMKLYCQTLSEVNERLKQQAQHHPPKRPLRDLYGTEEEQPRQHDEPERSR